MKASKSALKSTHTFSLSPSLSGCVSTHCLLALWQHIVHSTSHSGMRYIRDSGKGRSEGIKNWDVQVLSLVSLSVTSNVEARRIGVDEAQGGGGETI